MLAQKEDWRNGQMDKKKFIIITKKLFLCFYIEVSDELIKTWYDYFEKYGIEIYEKGVETYIKTNNKKPHISDMLDILDQIFKYSGKRHKPAQKEIEIETEYVYITNERKDTQEA